MSIQRRAYTLVLESLRRAVARVEALGTDHAQRAHLHVSEPVRIQRLLVTGAAGRVATLLRPFLRNAYPLLRLADCRPVMDLVDGEEAVLCELQDRTAITGAMRDVDAVLHLGAASLEATMDALIGPNIIGVTNVLEAARAANVRRVVLASSMHVLGLYNRFESIRPDSAPRSDSRYAVTKVFAEQLGRLFAEKWNMGVACLRIGHVMAERDEADPASWISPRDLAALVRMALEHPEIRFEIFHAVTHYAGDDCGQLAMERRFGMTFRDDGGTYTEALRNTEQHFRHDERARLYRGGSFASSEWEKA